jgi:PadR family transcriptional regulator PadR
MGEQFRMTLQTKLVLRAFSKSLTKPRYGLDIAKEAGLPTGTIYPILARLERAGVLKSAWEDVDPSEQGRPRRRHYWLTGEGVPVARQATASLYRLPWDPTSDGAHT